MIDRFLTGFIWFWLALFVAGNAIFIFAVFLSGGPSAVSEVFAQINRDHLFIELMLLGPAIFVYCWRYQLRSNGFGEALGTKSADGRTTAYSTGADDAFRKAQGVIQHHVDGAAAYAEKMVREFEAKGRPHGAGYWRRVYAVICEDQGKPANLPIRHHEQGTKASNYDWRYFFLDAVRLWTFVSIPLLLLWGVVQRSSGSEPSLAIILTIYIGGFLIVGGFTAFLRRYEAEVSSKRGQRTNVLRSEGRKGN